MTRFRIARMGRPENRNRDARIMTLLHQTHDGVGQIDLGVERLATLHKPLKDAAEDQSRTSAPCVCAQTLIPRQGILRCNSHLLHRPVVLYALDATGRRVDKSNRPPKASITQTKAPTRFVQAGALVFPGIEVYLTSVMVRVSVSVPAVSR